MTKPPAVPKAIKDAAKELSFPSETDAPVEAFAWPAGPVTAAGVLAATGSPARMNVKELSAANFFRSLPADLRGDYFPLLLAIIDHLSGVKVFKLGEITIHVYVVGTTADGYRAGVKTTVVET